MYQRDICHVLGCSDRLVIAVQRNVEKALTPNFLHSAIVRVNCLRKRAGSVTVRHCRILTARDASSQVRAAAMLLPNVAKKKKLRRYCVLQGVCSNRVV